MHKAVKKAFKNRSDDAILKIVGDIMNGDLKETGNILHSDYKFDIPDTSADGVHYVSLWTESGNILVAFKREGADGPILMSMRPEVSAEDESNVWVSPANTSGGRRTRKHKRRVRKTRRRV